MGCLSPHDKDVNMHSKGIRQYSREIVFSHLNQHRHVLGIILYPIITIIIIIVVIIIVIVVVIIDIMMMMMMMMMIIHSFILIALHPCIGSGEQS